VKRYDSFVIVKGNSIRKIAEETKDFLKFFMEIILLTLRFDELKAQVEEKEIIALVNNDNILNYLSGLLFEEN
jgi:hypothetical protein